MFYFLYARLFERSQNSIFHNTVDLSVDAIDAWRFRQLPDKWAKIANDLLDKLNELNETIRM